MELPHDPAIPFLGTDKRIENMFQINTCTWIFIAALFKMPKNEHNLLNVHKFQNEQSKCGIAIIKK